MTDTPIPEMVERVARAIRRASIDAAIGDTYRNPASCGDVNAPPVLPWTQEDIDGIVERNWRSNVPGAIAAIEEMRVPTYDMAAVGSEAEMSYILMIDKALGKA